MVERKNKTLEEMTRTMLLSSTLPQRFWAEVLSIACYVFNRALLRPGLEKTAYELLRGRKPNIMHLRTFGCRCYVHNNEKESLRKLDARSDDVVFMGYSI